VRGRHAGSPAVASVFMIAGAAPGLILVVFAHPACAATDFAGHLDFIFARRRSCRGCQSSWAKE
jgi:hypothetical protein